jgi:2-amino-4-hydroxy-6-hydroxymethyldihydropteridine diphosphokinase
VKQTVYLSLGSNLGDRAGNLTAAIQRLRGLGPITAVSSFYETEPVEVEDLQPWFLNCVVALETELSPQQLLARTLALEQAMGRQRTGTRSPRLIDIDILLFGTAVVEMAELTIPHPAMAGRRFVLEPLAEIVPDLRHPRTNLTVAEMLRALPENQDAVRRLSAGVK